MAPPAGTTRIVFYGSLGGGEEWSSGFWVNGVPIPNATAANEFADDIDTAANAGDAGGAMAYVIAHLMPANGSWDGTKVYHYAGGTNKADIIGQYGAPAARFGLHNQSTPNQVCQVVSLRTGLAGRRYRGRMYMPACGLALQADGTFPTDITTALAAHWGTFLTNLPGIGQAEAVIVSSTASVATLVTEVIVDDRPDIQRRRAESQAIPFRAIANVG